MDMIPLLLEVGNPQHLPMSPCPFCGCDFETDGDMAGLTVMRLNDHVRWHQVSCTFCGAAGPTGDYIAGAIADWNKREQAR